MTRRALTLLGLTVLALLLITGAPRLVLNPPPGPAQEQAVQLDPGAVAYQQAVDRFNRNLAAQMLTHRCEPVATWKRAHPGQYPARMLVHREYDTTVYATPWTYPAKPGLYVDGFC